MALTAAQLSDIQADLGIGSDASVFTDAELNRLFARASSDYQLAVLYGIRQILTNAARFHDYTRGDDSDKKQQIFDNLTEIYDRWVTETGVAPPLTAGTIEDDFIEPYSTTEYA